MDVERKVRALSNGRNDGLTVCYLRNEMTVHYVDVDETASVFPYQRNLFTQPGKIGRKDGRRKNCLFHAPDDIRFCNDCKGKWLPISKDVTVSAE